MFVLCSKLKGGLMILKIVLYEKYRREGNAEKGFYYRGIGEKIENEAETYLKNNYYADMLFHPSVTEPDEEMNVDFVDYYFSNYLSEKKRSKEITGSTEIACIVNFFEYLGPLGKNDFVKEDGKYVCHGFKLDQAWFEDEYRKLQNLRESFYRYHGFVTEVGIIPQEYYDLSIRQTGGLTAADNRIIWDCSDDQMEIGEKYYLNQDISQEEKKFFENMSLDKQIAIKNSILGDPLTDEEEKRLAELFDKILGDGIYLSVNINAKKDEKTRERFLDALNDVMHNVRTVRKWDEKNDVFDIEYVPVNCFGYFALKALRSIKTNQGYYNCTHCGLVELMKHESEKICKTCQNSRRQRKFAIRQDIKKGLSLNDILDKRTRMKKEEIIEHYNSIQNEIKYN